jgi:hypothetical protein
MSRGTSSIDRALAVYRDQYLVAIFRDRPGDIASALRGSAPCLQDAVVSGEIKAIEEEETLAALVRASASVDVLIDALEDAGYSVKPTPSI